MKTYEIHPYADIFPMASDHDFEALCDSIVANGILESVWLYQGKVLDGRNRLKACERLGKPPEYDDAPCETDGEALAFVMAKNLARRHLTPAQVAMVGANAAPHYEEITAANEKRGTLAPAGARVGKASEMAAEAVGSKARSVERAIKVQKKGSDELVDAVKSGKVGLGTAERALKLAPEKQREVAKAANPVAAVREALEEADDDDDLIYPDEVREWFDPLREAADRHQRAIGSLQNWLREITKKDAHDPGERMFHQDGPIVLRKLDEVYQFLKAYKPHAVCPGCLGTGRMRDDRCSTCKGERMVNEMQWNASSAEGKSLVYSVR